MKKKLALLLSAVMVATMVPMTAFAISDNSVDKVVTSTTDKDLAAPYPVLKMEKKNLTETNTATFKLTLTNAEWLSTFGLGNIFYDGSNSVTASSSGSSAVTNTRDYENSQGGKVFDSYTASGTPTADSVVPADLTAANKLIHKLVNPTLPVVGANLAGTNVVVDSTTDTIHLVSGKLYTTDGTDVFDVTASTVAKTYVEETTPAVAPVTGNGKLTKLSDTSVIIELTPGATLNDIRVQLATKVKGEGAAEVTIDPMESVLSSGTYKFANVASGSTVTTIEKKTDLQEAGSTIKSIVITEAAAGSLKYSTGGELKLKLSNGFEFTNAGLSANSFTTLPAGISVVSYPSLGTATIKADSDKQELYIKFPSFTATTQAATISISGLEVGYDDDDVKAGDIAEITVSGYDMSKTTIEVGTAVSYGVVVEAENKTLPTFVAGRYDSDKETLKVTFKETIRASWLDNRKTTITFPEGIKATFDTYTLKEGATAGAAQADFKVEQKADTTVVTFPNNVTRDSSKFKAEMKFNISADPGFTGDIVAKFSGAGMEADQEVVIGTVVAPVVVEAETNEVMIDYREVSVGDIIIKETDAGNLKKDTVLYLGLEYLDFDGTPKVEVVEGDIKIDSVKVKGGTLEIKIKTASNKTPAVLKVTDNKLFLGRSIPAGKYELSLVVGDAFDNDVNQGTDTIQTGSDAIFRNYADPAKETLAFDTDEVVVLEDFIDVVTSGRDTADLFTTQITVVIGADKLVAGKTDIALDVPAYISEGYTMLPVRAVSEALSGTAIVRWDDSTKTVTLTFGQRVVNMTVGSKTMVINGVNVQMSKACEITDSRSFIPLRDLGYALGLNDSKINWDDETKTATLN